MSDHNVPVIVAVGEVIDRPAEPTAAREPVVLMADALLTAERDADVALLAAIDSIDVVGQVTWRYADPVGRLCNELSVSPARRVNASMGGETPVRLVHEAALRISRGESEVAAIVGGEAVNALAKARAAKATLAWTPLVSRDEMVKLDSARLPIASSAKRAGATDPVHIYPLYENAWSAAHGVTPQDSTAASAELWSRYAASAARNPTAWLRTAPDAATIATSSAANRMVAFPYSKLMVANPSVNQAAAVIVASLAWARSMGVEESRLVYLWGGAAAAEPEDFLQRDRYDRSTAQEAVLRQTVAIAGGDPNRINHAELYSCFPVVPKMALETLALPPHVPPTVAGGLTFFGGPLNNYMGHGIAAMVRALRAHPGELGLVYGQGGVVSKHHALVLSTAPPSVPLSEDYSVQEQANGARDAVPEVVEDYHGPAVIETYTLVYGQEQVPQYGVVVARTPGGARLIAKVRQEDEASLAKLERRNVSAVGLAGHVRIDGFGRMVWEEGERRDRRSIVRQWCKVERDGALTIVTIDRAESMNALHPYANEELGEVFDDFAADPDQWVAIVTGAGDRAFSAGNDLKFTATMAARGERVGTPLTGFGGLTSRWNMTKPVIAAVNGIAMGGGFEIALACDLIIASDNAVFALPEPKVGLAALAGGMMRLPRQIGLKQAMGMILTGRRVSAGEGSALGFVNDVVPQSDLMATARRWAAEIMACSPMSVRASKDAVMRGLDERDVLTGYERQMRYPAVQALFGSDDVREGPLAFAQKRAPVWTGR